MSRPFDKNLSNMTAFVTTKDGKTGTIVDQHDPESDYITLKQRHGGIIYRKASEIKSIQPINKDEDVCDMCGYPIISRGSGNICMSCMKEMTGV